MQPNMQKARLKVGPSYPEASTDALAMGTLGDSGGPAGSDVRGEGPRRNWAQDGGQSCYRHVSQCITMTVGLLIIMFVRFTM